MIAAILALLFFTPAAFVYGRHRARRLKARDGDLKARLSALLPMPLLFAVCAAIAIIAQNEKPAPGLDAIATPGESVLDTGNGVVDAALTVARWLGELELILFMLALPFILGAIVAAVLLILDERGTITLAPDHGDTPPTDIDHPGEPR